MLLNNVRIALTDEPVNIRVKDGKIELLPGHSHDQTNQLEIDFDGATIFPGLINSHDHLDFNLFPALGDNIYHNYTEWGAYIHQNYKDKINEVLKIPEDLRNRWGVYKNLLCGVTTVVNHGKKIKDETGLITIYQDGQSIHSIQFEKRWRRALNNPLKKNVPAVIHTGEGTDAAAVEEIDQLIKWNILKRPLIGIHGVAMNETQAAAFKSLVWCPVSNYFLLNQTAHVDRLKTHVPILFGTDSTLTGDWNIWDHIRLARKTRLMNDTELYNTLTTNAATAWNLNTGAIATGKDADLVIAKTKAGAPCNDTFFCIEPADILMVIHKGEIRLFDEELYPQLKKLSPDAYNPVYISGSCKYVQGDLPLLMQQVKEYYPEANFPVTTNH